MNSGTLTPTQQDGTPRHVEYFRLPQPGKRDPYFGLSPGWYYKAAAAGEIRLIAARHAKASRGVRLVAYDSVADFIRRSVSEAMPATA